MTRYGGCCYVQVIRAVEQVAEGAAGKLSGAENVAATRGVRWHFGLAVTQKACGVDDALSEILFQLYPLIASW